MKAHRILIATLVPAPLLAAFAAVALMLAAGASGSPNRASGTLQLDAKFAVEWKGGADCPEGTSATLICYEFVGDSVVPGVGHVTARYTKTFDNNFSGGCVHTLPAAVIEVAGKGKINVSMVGPECESLPPAQSSFEAMITGGSGTYAGASGSVQIKSSVSERGGGQGIAADSWIGTLTVPGLDFDVTAPSLKGVVSKTVRAPKNAKRVRVRYTVTAQDASDGSVPVTCRPRSGSFFKLGRTKVTCSATDSSSNTRQTQFTVTVTRPRT
jgi:hypothetical protein